MAVIEDMASEKARLEAQAERRSQVQGIVGRLWNDILKIMGNIVAAVGIGAAMAFGCWLFGAMTGLAIPVTMV